MEKERIIKQIRNYQQLIDGVEVNPECDSHKIYLIVEKQKESWRNEINKLKNELEV